MGILRNAATKDLLLSSYLLLGGAIRVAKLRFPSFLQLLIEIRFSNFDLSIVKLRLLVFGVDFFQPRSSSLWLPDFPGGLTARVTPVPIPNTEVKPCRADDTALETTRERRSPPGLNSRPHSPKASAAFLFSRRHPEPSRSLLADGGEGSALAISARREVASPAKRARPIQFGSAS
jgi:hypothetical protein